MGVFQCFMSLVSCDARAGDGRPQPRGRLTFAGFQGAPAVRPRNVWLNTPFRGGLYTRREGRARRTRFSPGRRRLVARPLPARAPGPCWLGQAARPLPTRPLLPCWKTRLGYSRTDTQVGISRQMNGNPDLGIRRPIPRSVFSAERHRQPTPRSVFPAGARLRPTPRSAFMAKTRRRKTRHKEPPCLKARSKAYVLLDHTTGHRPRREEAWAS